MAVKTIKPNTSARRNISFLDFSKISKKKPEKTLLKSRKNRAGRNNQGKITVRHRGGGSKGMVRMVDFKQNSSAAAEILALEYDPNRSANIALIKKDNGQKAYVLATVGMQEGSKISVGKEAEIKAGNRLKLKNIPIGSVISNIELYPGRGGQLARVAGARAQLVSKDDPKNAQIKLPSGEIRLVSRDCMATIGQVGNIDHQNITIGNAGRKRRMGIRPTVRGKVMNPVDHPHGGGEGRASIGLDNPKTPWGKPALGYKTRRRKYTNKFIVKGRKRGKRK